jgi:hypothetical protein
MKPRWPALVMVLCAGGFVAGLTLLFGWRFQSGDVYPPYSSLRADPLGTMALYESLDAVPGVSVERDYSSDNSMPEGKATVYLHTACKPSEWEWVPGDAFHTMDGFLLGGGRLVITFFPEPSFSFSDWWNESASSGTNTAPTPAKPGAPRQQKGKPGRREQMRRNAGEFLASEGSSLEEHWGAGLAMAPLHEDGNGGYVPALALRRDDLQLPEDLDWHSGIVFTNLTASWRTIYARGTNPVVIERKFGAGTIVMASDSYFLSNEAMRRDRHADLLAWLVGPDRHIVFDESHFGIMETSGVSVLMRKYRLQGFGLAILLLAALFIWKNFSSLVPPQADEAPPGWVAGRDAAAGYVNLLRRNIPSREVLNVCFAEWTKSLRHGGAHTIASVERAQSVMETASSRAGSGDPVQCFRDICAALKIPRSSAAPPSAGPERKSSEGENPGPGRAAQAPSGSKPETKP